MIVFWDLPGGAAQWYHPHVHPHLHKGPASREEIRCFKWPPQKRKSAKALLLNHERRKHCVAKTNNNPKTSKTTKTIQSPHLEEQGGGLPSYCATWAHMFRESFHGWNRVGTHILFFECSMYVVFSFLSVKQILVLHLYLYIDYIPSLAYIHPCQNGCIPPEAAKGWQTWRQMQL